MTNYSPTRGVVTTNPLYNDGEVFPYLPGEDFRASKAPTWSTGVKAAANGREVRNPYFASPIYEYKITHEFLRNISSWPEVESLLAFFNSRQGKYGFFFYYDLEDPQVSNLAVATGNGSATIFQLIKARGVGTPYQTTEPVYAVWNPAGGVAGIKTLQVWVNGVLQTYGTGYTIAPWGQLTFATAPASGATLTWSGCPLSVCRFDQDNLDLVQLASLLWTQSKGLTFKTFPP